jgi:hypothetical protein
LKPEWWGSPLVQEEKYQEKPVKREEKIITIIIICNIFTIASYKIIHTRDGFDSNSVTICAPG